METLKAPFNLWRKVKPVTCKEIQVDDASIAGIIVEAATEITVARKKKRTPSPPRVEGEVAFESSSQVVTETKKMESTLSP